MKNLITVVLLFILAALAVETTKGQIVLPIEVLGEGVVHQRTFNLSSTAGIDSLWLQTNNTSTLRSKAAKVAYRINGGAWVELDDTNTNCYWPASQMGCLWGYQRTVKSATPISGLVVGDNDIDFKYIASDGNSSGFRVLDFNVLASSVKQIPPGDFTNVDPATWTQQGSAQDILDGEVLFKAENTLTLNDLDPTIIPPSCEGCHFKGGRDLKLFNYSDSSIVVRSVFHGLSVADGQKIAAYIRDNADVADPSARPWSPAYQPGPGLDAKDHAGWLAGAGLDYVFDDDVDTLPYAQAQIDSLELIYGGDLTRGDFNMRELPQAFMYPDWSQWLPVLHPSQFDPNFDTSDAMTQYNEVYTEFANPNRTIWSIARKIDDFIESDDPANANTSTEQNTINLHSFRLWKGLKVIELHFEYENYEVAGYTGVDFVDLISDIYPAFSDGRAHGEARGLVGIRGSSHFLIAPHRLAGNYQEYPYLSEINGLFSSGWYRVAVTLNPGARLASEQNVIDWKYQAPHISNDTWSQHAYPQAVYMYMSMFKSWQQYNKDLCATESASWTYPGDQWIVYRRNVINLDHCAIGPADDANYSYGWNWRLGSPSGSGPHGSNESNGLFVQAADRGSLTKAQTLSIVEPMALAHIIRTEDFTADDWTRGDGSVLTVATATSVCAAPNTGYFLQDQEESTQICRLIPYWDDLGVSTVIQQRWADWAEVAWPLNNYDALVGSPPAVPGAPTLSAPADLATNQPLDVVLSWLTDPDASSFDVEYDNDGAGFPSSTLVNVATNSHQFNFSETGETIHWRVRGVNPAGNGTWSTVRSFTLESLTFTARNPNQGEFILAGDAISVTDTVGTETFKVDYTAIADGDTLFAVIDSVVYSADGPYNRSAGIAIEDTVDADNPYLYMAVTPSSVKMFWRHDGSTADSAQYAVFPANGYPICLRGYRNGNTAVGEWAYEIGGTCTSWAGVTVFGAGSTHVVDMPSTANYVGTVWVRSRATPADATAYIRAVRKD